MGAEDENAEIILRARLDDLDTGARRIGLYLDRADVMPVPESEELVGVASMTVGTVAFTERVQFPDENAIDTEFAGIAADLQQDDFLDVRNDIAARLARGEDPFA